MNAKSLLVIDDEPAITRLVQRVAESCGFEVVATSDPQMFKQQVQDAAPTVICIDLAMPGMDGIELMRFLADQRCTSRLFLMSGSHAQLLDTALRLGEALGRSASRSAPSVSRAALP
jgi:CheY-like chemotaxis protein